MLGFAAAPAVFIAFAADASDRCADTGCSLERTGRLPLR